MLFVSHKRGGDLTKEELRLQCQTKHEVCFLRTWVGRNLTEDRYRERVSNLNRLGSPECQVGNSKACCTIEIGSVRYCTCRSIPVNSKEFEWDVDFKVTTVSTLAFLVKAIVAGKVRKPLYGCKTKVITYEALENVVRAVCTIFEVTAVRVKTYVEPIVGDTEIKALDGIVERQVKLLRVIRVGKTVTAPCFVP